VDILKNTFGKEEKLCSEKDIDILYKTGTSFLQHPVVFYYLPAAPSERFTRVLVSVSKKKFKKAVDRNLVKRRLREAYRLNKRSLSKTYHLALVFVANSLLNYPEIEKAVKQGLEKIQKDASSPLAGLSSTKP
jgi:ribonuclease P protein component